VVIDASKHRNAWVVANAFKASKPFSS